MAGQGPVVQKIGESYYAVWKQHDLVLEFARLTDHRDSLSAELTVTHTELFGTLHWSRVNLSAAAGRQPVIKALDESGLDIPWRKVLERSCQAVAIEHRKPDAAEFLEPGVGEGEFWLLEPWLPLHQTTVIFGDGGTGKSLFCLALAVSGILGHSLGGPWRVGPIERVLYLDWEATKQTHERRLWGLTQPLEALPEHAFLYRRLRQPLVDVVDVIRADCDRHRPDLVITDSLGAACGPEPEGADAALRTLNAIGSLPGSQLVVAHVSKATADEPKARPYGSVYVHNIARSIIRVRRTDDGEGIDATVTLSHEKNNYGRKARTSALMFSFDPDGHIRVTSAEPDLSTASLATQIIALLRTGSQGVAVLSEHTSASRATLRSTLARMERRGIVVKVDTRMTRGGEEVVWGLVDTRRGTEEC